MKYLSIPICNIIGARRNPDKNPKSNKYDDFMHWYNKEIQVNSEISTYYISFTEKLKIGINPNNKYGTPIGVYCYPIKSIYRDFMQDTIPFASDRPIIQVLKINTSRILCDTTYTTDRYNKDIERIRNLFNDNLSVIKDKFDDFQSLKVPGLQRKYSNINFAVFLHMVYEMAINLAKVNNRSLHIIDKIWSATRLLSMLITGAKNTIQWNRLLRNIGYLAIVDTGLGFIHPNERTQCVFLNINAYKHVDTIFNVSRSSPIDAPSSFLARFVNMSQQRYNELYKVNSDIAKLQGTKIDITEKKNRLIITGGLLYCREITGFSFRNRYMYSTDDYIKKQSTIQVSSKSSVMLQSCNIHIGTFTNCTLVDCVIFGGIFENCSFINCDWIAGSYKAMDIMIVNASTPYWEVEDTISNDFNLVVQSWNYPDYNDFIKSLKKRYNAETTFQIAA